MADGDREILRGAAFGSQPGSAPLPPAPDTTASWWRGVALGGQGRHAAARAELARVASSRDPVHRSLALSTLASLQRQLGGHARAAELDGAALGLVAGGKDGRGAGTRHALARCDALTGLAADALGGPGAALAVRLLGRARGDVDVLAGSADGWRVATRWHWVSAEAALYLDEPVQACRHARIAAELAAAGPSVRHHVKSALVLAAASGAVPGEPRDAVGRARAARDAAEHHGLLPLAWAADMLLTGLEPRLTSSDGEASARAAQRSATLRNWNITERGGSLLTERRRRSWSSGGLRNLRVTPVP